MSANGDLILKRFTAGLQSNYNRFCYAERSEESADQFAGIICRCFATLSTTAPCS